MHRTTATQLQHRGSVQKPRRCVSPADPSNHPLDADPYPTPVPLARAPRGAPPGPLAQHQTPQQQHTAPWMPVPARLLHQGIIVSDRTTGGP